MANTSLWRRSKPSPSPGRRPNGHKHYIFVIYSKYLDSLEKEMQPSSEATKLEGKNLLHEYRAANKLSGIKAFITGGE
jgi:hypothetical protein